MKYEPYWLITPAVCLVSLQELLTEKFQLQKNLKIRKMTPLQWSAENKSHANRWLDDRYYSVAEKFKICNMFIWDQCEINSQAKNPTHNRWLDDHCYHLWLLPNTSDGQTPTLWLVMVMKKLSSCMDAWCTGGAVGTGNKLHHQWYQFQSGFAKGNMVLKNQR